MKKIYSITTLLLITIGSLFSQTYPLRDRLDLVFANINKTQIPTGFLEEYGIALARFTPFNGVLSVVINWILPRGAKPMQRYIQHA